MGEVGSRGGSKEGGGDAFLSLKKKMYVIPFIIFNYVWVCLSACGYVRVQVPMEARSIQFPGAGVIGSFALPGTGHGD